MIFLISKIINLSVFGNTPLINSSVVDNFEKVIEDPVSPYIAVQERDVLRVRSVPVEN